MKVFIVEDADIIKDRILDLVADISGATVVGHAADEQTAIRQIRNTPPDAVILDIRLKTGSGIGVLRAVKKTHPNVKIMMLSNLSDDIYVTTRLDAGADCFFDKSFEFFRLGTALKQMTFLKEATV